MRPCSAGRKVSITSVVTARKVTIQKLAQASDDPPFTAAEPPTHASRREAEPVAKGDGAARYAGTSGRP